MRIKKTLIVALALIMALAFTFTITGCNESEDEATEPTTEESSEHANPTNIYAALAGEYQDEVSQRATATLIADLDSENVNITVMWAEDMDSAEKWEMNAVMGVDKLIYDDCSCSEIKYDTDGNVIDEEVKYTGESGYFEFGEQGQLLWTGATDDDCKTCSFILIEE